MRLMGSGIILKISNIHQYKLKQKGEELKDEISKRPPNSSKSDESHVTKIILVKIISSG